MSDQTIITTIISDGGPGQNGKDGKNAYHWDMNVLADTTPADIFIKEAMTVNVIASRGTGTPTYWKATVAAPDVFTPAGPMPITFTGPMWLRVTFTGITNGYASCIEKV